MPVRLLRPYLGQAVNTLFWGPADAEDTLRGTGAADDQIELASDYVPNVRVVTGPSANVVAAANQYHMNSSTLQTLGLRMTGYFPVGTTLSVIQLGSAPTTIAPIAGVVVNTRLSSLVTTGQYAVGVLTKTGPTTWLASGGFGG